MVWISENVVRAAVFAGLVLDVSGQRASISTLQAVPSAATASSTLSPPSSTLLTLSTSSQHQQPSHPPKLAPPPKQSPPKQSPPAKPTPLANPAPPAKPAPPTKPAPPPKPTPPPERPRPSPRPSSTSSTSTEYSFPDWIRPTANTQACDIWGPLCQTGSITVAENLTSTTTTTVVPCSSYLSAQALSVAGPGVFQGTPDYVGDKDYSSSFGRTPQCTSFALGLGSVDWSPTATYRPLEYPNCDNSSGTLLNPNQYSPGGVFGHRIANGYPCCGGCQLGIDEIQLIYFPDFDTNETCSKGMGNRTSSRAGPITARALPTAEAGGAVTTVVMDGYTFTSPSIYISVKGTARVFDQCGDQPKTLTNPIVPVPAGGLSTISYEMTEGMTYMGHRAYPAHTKQLVLRDLACPTFGFSNEFHDPGTGARRSVGPPYNPLVVAPPELLNADPEWFCNGWEDPLSPFVVTFGVFDPPIALKTVQNPFATPKPMDPGPITTRVSATPRVTPVNSPPRQTPTPAPTPIAANPGNQNPENPSHGNPSDGAPDNGNPTNGNPANGAPANGNPANGNPANSNPVNGSPSNGNPSPENPSDGSPVNSNPINDNPANGNPANGAPGNGGNANPVNGFPENGNGNIPVNAGNPSNPNNQANPLNPANPNPPSNPGNQNNQGNPPNPALAAGENGNAAVLVPGAPNPNNPNTNSPGSGNSPGKSEPLVPPIFAPLVNLIAGSALVELTSAAAVLATATDPAVISAASSELASASRLLSKAEQQLASVGASESANAVPADLPALRTGNVNTLSGAAAVATGNANPVPVGAAAVATGIVNGPVDDIIIGIMSSLSAVATGTDASKAAEASIVLSGLGVAMTGAASGALFAPPSSAAVGKDAQSTISTARSGQASAGATNAASSGTTAAPSDQSTGVGNPFAPLATGAASEKSMALVLAFASLLVWMAV